MEEDDDSDNDRDDPEWSDDETFAFEIAADGQVDNLNIMVVDNSAIAGTGIAKASSNMLPEIFLPLRILRGKMEFRNLSARDLSAEQILVLVSMYQYV